MKKTYFKPYMQVIEFLSVNMLALSVEVGREENGKAETSGKRGKRNDWNDIIWQ